MRALVAGVASVLLCIEPTHAGTAKEEARQAARRFGAALTSSKASDLRPLLPTRGNVTLALNRLAQEEGSFGPSQVEAVFRDSLAQVVVRSFEVLRLESDEQTFALVHARASLTDRQGRPCRLSVHLSFQPEDDTWVIREIKETLE